MTPQEDAAARLTRKVVRPANRGSWIEHEVDTGHGPDPENRCGFCRLSEPPVPSGVTPDLEGLPEAYHRARQHLAMHETDPMESRLCIDCFGRVTVEPLLDYIDTLRAALHPDPREAGK